MIAANDNAGRRGGNCLLRTTLPSFSFNSKETLPDPSTYRLVVTAVDSFSYSEQHLFGVTTGFIHNVAGGPYEIKVFSGQVSSISNPQNGDIKIPQKYMLAQNYPNPFNSSSTIEYALPISRNIKITITDLLGRHIRTLVKTNKAAGFYHTSWDGTDDNNMPVAAAIYFYKMEAGEFVEVKKLLLLK